MADVSIDARRGARGIRCDYYSRGGMPGLMAVRCISRAEHGWRMQDGAAVESNGACVCHVVYRSDTEARCAYALRRCDVPVRRAADVAACLVEDGKTWAVRRVDAQLYRFVSNAMQAVTWAKLPDVLTTNLDRPVIYKTVLTAHYDFDLMWGPTGVSVSIRFPIRLPIHCNLHSLQFTLDVRLQSQ